MDTYNEFAKVYDLFMDNVPYKDWMAHICHVLHDSDISEGLILDLGCGTGTMTRLLAEEGYDMIGVDGSEEMLMEAREAAYADKEAFTDEPGEVSDEDAVVSDEDDSNAEPQILYLCQDMTSFELYGTVRAIVSVCDCMNYLLSEEDLLTCFKLANNYLDPKGLFIFDMNSISKYQAMGEATICENRDEGSFIWENYYNDEDHTNQYDVTFYVESEDAPGLYERFEETHLQRGYSIEVIKKLLEDAGLEFVGAYDGYSDEPAGEDSERILFVARECTK